MPPTLGGRVCARTSPYAERMITTRALTAVVAGAALIALLAGCTEDSGPPPTTASPSASPSPSPPTSSEVPAVTEPIGVFDIECADVASAVDEVVGFGADGVKERMGLMAAPNWYPGPAEFMMQRAGAMVCAYDGERHEDGSGDSWEIVIVPHAQRMINALISTGYSEVPSECFETSCTLMARAGDALLVGSITGASITSDDTGGAQALAQTWAENASASQQEEEFVVAPSVLAGAGCEQLLTVAQLGAIAGTTVDITDHFGGWSVESEIYTAVNGGAICVYRPQGGGEYEESYLQLTDLPGGAWAFDRIEGRTPIEIAGADKAYFGNGDGLFPRPSVDILVGDDWIRLTGSESSTLDAVAEAVATHAASIGENDPGAR